MLGRVEGTDTMFVVHKHEVPSDRQRDVKYGRIVWDCRKGKTKPNQTQLAVRGTKSMTQMTAAPPLLTYSLEVISQ